MARPAVRIVICATGIAAILLLALVPSARVCYRHGLELWQAWQNRLLLSPAFWIWLWASWLSVFLPMTLVAKALPFLGIEDAPPRLVASTLAAYTVIAMGVAVFWHFVGWGSMPSMPGGEVRWIPFWPWPRTGFTSYVLRSDVL